MTDGFFEGRIPRITTPVGAEALRHMLETVQPAVENLRAVEPESEMLPRLEADVRTIAAALAEYDIRKRTR